MSEPDSYKAESSQALPPRRRAQSQIPPRNEAYRHPWLHALSKGGVAGVAVVLADLALGHSGLTAAVAGTAIAFAWFVGDALRSQRARRRSRQRS